MAMAQSADKFYRAQITARTDVAEDLWTITLKPEGEFKFNAGQYATLGAETPKGFVERAYSIVSSPYEPELEIFFELVPQGELTPTLYQMQPGQTLSMRKVAKGRFTLDTASGRTHHLLLCTVTGVAPFVSYVRMLARDWKEGRFKGEHTLHIVQGASYSREFTYREELERLAGEMPWLTYVPTVSRPWEDPEWTGETGRVDDLIRKYTDLWSLDPEKTTGYLCGHPDMVENGKGILKRRRWRKEALREEVYFILKPGAAD
jgi:ferredoxin/flavodoxin---NADP+ reductase